MIEIHPTSVVDRQATIGEDVRIGPNCCVGPKVVLGDRCVLHNNVTIVGNTRIGATNEFFPCAVIGCEPQDLKYRGTDTQLIIGSDNVFRENVTIHTGTEVAGGVTRIGDHNCLLVGCHVAHDCEIGSHCILSNCVQLAGHVCIEDRVSMGGIIGIHHFVTIGTLSFIAGLTRVTVDVPPFMIMAGSTNGRVRGLNLTGMSRWGFDEARVKAIRDVYRLLFSRRGAADGKTVVEKIAKLESNGELTDDTRYLVEFIKRSTQDGVFGRYRESLRQDTAADSARFYNRAAEGAQEVAS
jgi:UDP-N-acetylglucosamine acyltransferase